MRTVEPFVSRAIKQIIDDMRKPRLLCVCGAFKDCGKEEYYFHKCANCGGWMSEMRLMEYGSYGDPRP